uniref:ATP-dependent RNA helicase n=1 Tax=Tamarix hispida TaxID=189793 RepID=G1FCJ2_9CARY|nr:putative DEAD-box ATP-dependent RNA helicase [Tamarix hispida]
MPVKAPPLNLFRSSLPLTRLPQMSLNPTRYPSRLPFNLSRAFPFKLSYLGFGYSRSSQFNNSSRASSSRPFRTKPDLGTRDGEMRASKSLIEDEEEISDWISKLRTSSNRAGALTEDEEDIEQGRGKKRVRGGNGDRVMGSFRGERGGTKKGRGGAFSEFSVTGGSGSRNSYNPSSRNARFGSKLDSEYDGGGRDVWKSSRRKGDGREEMKRGGRDFQMMNERQGVGARRIEKVGARRTSFVSDDEMGNIVKEKSVSKFLDLIGEDVSEEEDDDDNAGDEPEIQSRSSLFGKDSERDNTPPGSSVGSDDSYLSETRFDQCDISPLSLKAVKDAGYEKMTMVQEATLPVILKGKDVMAKAKTGTGKTVAFLLPSIELVVKSPPVGRDQKRPPILVLVVCPTRELANQAAKEAGSLLKYHPSIGCQVVIGGTRLAVEQKRMQANPCQILVATPGRLRDHLENTAGFATRLMGVKVLVLDEADHLLDMGFRKDIERIIAAVPKQRQTLLFSATIPDEVRQICHVALKRDHDFINKVQEGSGQTHSQVRQMHLVAPLETHFLLLYAILGEHISDDVNYKVLVFCTTAMMTQLVADLLGELNLNVREIHSRKSQSYRTRVSDEFRKSKGLILVTSDVSARGVDYPDVTLVIQMGVPSGKEQYIHRLGRTGRKGKEGQGILLLAPWEEFFLSSVRDLPITKAPVPMVDPDMRKKVERALSHVEMKHKESAYQAWLGYYNSNKNIGRDKFRLVELANEFSQSMGLANPPAIPKLVLGKMGLRNVPGLRSK